MSELTPVVPPCTSLSLPTESFHPFASPARTSISLWLRAIGSHSVEAMMARWTEMDDSLSLMASDAEELSGSYHAPRPLAFCVAQRIQLRHGCRWHDEVTTESCICIAWQRTQYSFRTSGNRGYISNRVRSLSILQFVLRLI